MASEFSSERLPIIFDRLYGQVEFSPDDLRLYQSRELARLRQVSLSAVPTWTAPAGVCASKFEHSVGVAHLAGIVGHKEEFANVAKDLYFAALAHDIGTPPFSHLSEYYQILVLGINHEQFAADVLADSEFMQEAKKQGGSEERILNYIQGKEKPISDLLNGSIDLDNLDNTLRFGLSIGLIASQLYSPEELTKAYALSGSQLVLLSEHAGGMPGWERTRIEVYKYVYGEANFAAGSMIFRALEFAYRDGLLDRNYFLMTDSQAFNYLLSSPNPRVSTLVDMASRWIYYSQVYNRTSATPTESAINFVTDSTQQGVLADEIAMQLGVPLENVSVFMGRNKGFKRVHLPTVSKGNESLAHNHENELTYYIQVYIHPRLADRSQEIKEIVEDKVSL